MRTLVLLLISFIFLNGVHSQSNDVDLLKSMASSLNDIRGLNIALRDHHVISAIKEKSQTKIKYDWFGIQVSSKKYDWFGIQVSSKEKELINTSTEIEATIKNTSKQSIEIMLWVVADKGWNSVGNSFEIQPNETKVVSCNLRATFPDGTPKLNPDNIQQIRVMLIKARVGSAFELQKLIAKGTSSKFIADKNRLEVPNIEFLKPKAGKRVAYKLDKNSNLYSVLYLPKSYDSSKIYPVIVEFPGNIFYTNKVYSTGKPEQCVIGFGMTKGENAIWISMPFVDYEKDEIVESGWGNPDDTADYTVKTVNEIIKKFGGDKSNLVLTGFSRGAIACGFIGLRNNTIAELWKGMHVCQHYDGDGWGGADMEDAMGRLKKFRGISFFQTDNSKRDEPKQMLLKANIKTIFVNSGLRAHACDMFLDDRPSTLKLRHWFQELVSK